MLNSITGRFEVEGGTGIITVDAPGNGRYLLIKSISLMTDMTASINIGSPSATTIIWGGLGSDLRSCRQVFPKDGEPRGVENGPLKITCSCLGGWTAWVSGVIAG